MAEFLAKGRLSHVLFALGHHPAERWSRLLRVEMCLGMGFPFFMGFPRESHGNRNISMLKMLMRIGRVYVTMGTGMSTFSSVPKFPLVDSCEFSFLPRDAMLSVVYVVVVCLCVCLSVTLRYCIKTAKCRITQITPYDSPRTLVFWHQSSRRNSNGITPYGGDKCRWGGLKFVSFDEKRAITRKRYKIDT